MAAFWRDERRTICGGGEEAVACQPRAPGTAKQKFLLTAGLGVGVARRGLANHVRGISMSVTGSTIDQRFRGCPVADDLAKWQTWLREFASMIAWSLPTPRSICLPDWPNVSQRIAARLMEDPSSAIRFSTGASIRSGAVIP